MRVAIAGGIGSGKSEVLKVAAELGLHTLSADEINSQLLENPIYIEEIATAFPGAVKDGAVDRGKLAEIVFSDNEQLKILNSIAHPRILQSIADSASDSLVVEMPLLYECGAQNMFDGIIYVYTPLELRYERLEKRGLDRAHAESRIKAQANEDEVKTIATAIIDNSSDLNSLREKSAKLLCEMFGIRK